MVWCWRVEVQLRLRIRFTVGAACSRLRVRVGREVVKTLVVSLVTSIAGTRALEDSMDLDSPTVVTSPISGYCCVAKANKSVFGDASLRV